MRSASRGLSPISNRKSTKDRRAMYLYCCLRDTESTCDLLVRLSFADKPQHVSLTRREPRTRYGYPSVICGAVVFAERVAVGPAGSSSTARLAYGAGIVV